MSSAESHPKINKIKLDNFKSLVGFEMKLAAFTCLIGLNGAGKTTVLQAMDFLSQLMNGRLTEWLKQRDWEASDLLCKLDNKGTLKFSVHLTLNNGQPAVWDGKFNTQAQRLYCSAETVTVAGKTALKVAEGKYILAGQTTLSPIAFTYQGSILSQLKDSVLTPELLHVKQTLQGIKSLELLSPHLMRQRARQADDVGVGGEKLSAFLDSLPGIKKQAIIQKMKEFYPDFNYYQTSSITGGWRKLLIEENFLSSDPERLIQEKLQTEARHINDGLLRLLTILAQAQTAHSFLLFDEIENGFNPELVEKLVNVLLKASQQVLVTTHSPMILNYLPDEVARESVMFIYRTPEGHTKATPFFTIPTVAHKLGLLGPGEVFVDTDLTALVQELNAEQRPA